MEKPTDDPIDRIRRSRHEISVECEHDPRKLVVYYQQLQGRHGDRLISFPVETKARTAARTAKTA